MLHFDSSHPIVTRGSRVSRAPLTPHSPRFFKILMVYLIMIYHYACIVFSLRVYENLIDGRNDR